LEELEQHFQLLVESTELLQFTPPVRLSHHGIHLIVYHIEDNHIVIIRILHDSMDIARHL